VVKSSKEAQEKEYFGGDKKNYAVAEAFLDGWCMMALKCAFSHDIPPPLEYGE